MWFVSLVVLLASLVRVPFIAELPRGFTPDEAAFGYNAYSLLKTGMDEWSTPFWRLPMTNLRSFGDYKLPLYTFFVVPTIKLFGVNEFSTRLPNAVLGSLGVVVIYVMARKIVPSSPLVAKIGALSYALSPWSIQLSRGAFEANLSPFFLMMTLALLLYKRIFLAAISLGLVFYSYHSGRLLAVIFLIGTVYLLKKLSKKITFAVIVLILILPGSMSFLGERMSDVAITSPTDNWQAVSNKRFEAVGSGEPDVIARMFSNKITYLSKISSTAYLQYFSPEFLFISGPGESTYGMIRGRGVLYLVEAVGLLGFVITLVKQPTKRKILLLVLLAISCTPAVFAKGPGYSANRAASMIPWLIIVNAWGMCYVVENFKYKKIVKTGLVITYMVSSIFFIEEYIFHSPNQTAHSMNYGWREIVTRSEALFKNVDSVQVDTGLSEPQIFLAFYLQIPPKEYQYASTEWKKLNTPGLKFLDQYDGYYLKKFRFGNIHPQDFPSESTLFIGRPELFSQNQSEHFHVNYPDGSMAIKVSQSK